MTDRSLTTRVALVLVAALAVSAVLVRLSSRGDPSAMADMTGVPVAATKVEWPKSPRTEGDPLLTPPPRAARLPTLVVIEGQVDPLGSAVFRNGSTLIRVRHLTGLARDAVCHGEDGLPWNCGLQGRAALVNVLRSNRARCLPALDAPGEKDAFQCWVGEQDLSRMMIRSGWARPSPLHAATYATDLDAAMSTKTGLWRGKWPRDVVGPPLVSSSADIHAP